MRNHRCLIVDGNGNGNIDGDADVDDNGNRNVDDNGDGNGDDNGNTDDNGNGNGDGDSRRPYPIMGFSRQMNDM